MENIKKSRKILNINNIFQKKLKNKINVKHHLDQ